MSSETTLSGVTPAGKPAFLWMALVLAVLCSVLFQGSRGLYESTEGRYVECARETLDSGQLLEPMLNGEHHWSKPPLTYAAIAAGLACFGNNAWGARAYLAVAFVVTVFSVYLAGRCLWDEQAAGLAALIYATSPFTVGAANAISTDTLLVCFQALATACFWLAMARNQKRYMVGMWAALGFAALAKGPAGFIPLAGIVPAYIVLRRGEKPTPSLFSIPGIALFTLIGVGWYAIEIVRHPFLLRYWVMDEVVGRFAENEFQRNPEFSKIFTVYPPVLLFGTGPWIVLLALKWKYLGLSRQMLAQWRQGPYRAQWWYFACGILLPFVSFTASTSRLSLYVLPLFVPIALLMGKGLSFLLETRRITPKLLTGVGCVFALLLVTSKGVSAEIPSRKNMEQLAAQIRPVLEARPGRAFVALYTERMNGLEFYLDRSIPSVGLEKRTGESPVGKPEDAILAPDTLVLGRTKVLKPLVENIFRGRYELLFQNQYWTLGCVNEAVDMQELRREVESSKERMPVSARR